MRPFFKGASRRHGVLIGILLFGLSLCISLHLVALIYKEQEHAVEIKILAERLPPEVCEAIKNEEKLMLDGRFALYKSKEAFSPTLLRFYDAEELCEYSVPSKKYSNLEITLQAAARRSSFGAALYGVRTVNVGMRLSLYGERTKLFATCIEIRILD